MIGQVEIFSYQPHAQEDTAMGQLYRRKKRDGTEGPIWWIKYYTQGRPVRESTGTTKETDAKRMLKEREGRVATGQLLSPWADRVTYETMAAELRTHYEATGERDLVEADTRLKPLGKFFRGCKLAAIGDAQAKHYVLQRQKTGRAAGTINRELSMLIKMLRFAYERGRLLRLPVIHKLKEAAPRQGFFEPEQFEAVCQHLPKDLQVAVGIAYLYGWRMQSEILTLTRRQVNLEAQTLRLDPGTTKNEEGRLVYLTPELMVRLRARTRPRSRRELPRGS